MRRKARKKALLAAPLVIPSASAIRSKGTFLSRNSRTFASRSRASFLASGLNRLPPTFGDAGSILAICIANQPQVDLVNGVDFFRRRKSNYPTGEARNFKPLTSGRRRNERCFSTAKEARGPCRGTG